MLDFQKVIEICSENLEDVTVNHKKQGIHARCPLCGDSKKSKKKKRLHIDFYAPYGCYISKCYNCGYSGNFVDFYAKVKNISYADSKKILLFGDYNPDDLKKRMGRREETVKVSVKEPTDLTRILEESFGLDHVPQGRTEERYHKALKDFVETRKIPVNCWVATQGTYQGRIIIPVFVNSELVYFQGRAISDLTEPKYLNPKVEKEHVILNLDHFDKKLSIIVTEGLLDAMMVEYNQGTCCLGASISDEFMEILFGLDPEGVILALDNDEAGETATKIFIKESKFAKKVRYFSMPSNLSYIKDFNELVAKGLVDGPLYDFVVKNSCTSFKWQILHR